MKRIHIAIGVADIETSVEEYTKIFECSPSIVVPNEYALWRTNIINFSIRKTTDGVGALRHLGWEDKFSQEFTSETDINNIIWERFNAAHQADEINRTWPGTNYSPR